MTQPTNDPEETATPETKKLESEIIAVCESVKRCSIETQMHQVALQLSRAVDKCASLELRAQSAEKERDELREILKSIHDAYDAGGGFALVQAIQSTRTKPAQ